MAVRTIIFRGKRIDNGEWVEGSYYQCRMETYEMAIEAWNRRCGDDSN